MPPVVEQAWVLLPLEHVYYVLSTFSCAHVYSVQCVCVCMCTHTVCMYVYVYVYRVC